MADIFSTDSLVQVVRYLPQPNTFLLDTFFPNIQQEQSEFIHFDVENGKRRIAPFVSPLVEGKIVEEQGFVAKEFKPAYVKPKTAFNPNRAIKRAKGERIGGEYSPQQRIEMAVADTLLDHSNMIKRRLELMAAEALRLGQVTVSGERYPTTVVNYGRDAGLSVTLTNPNRWSDSGIEPLDNLTDWSQTVLQKSGAPITDWVMTVDVWKVFYKNANVKALLDRFRGNSQISGFAPEPREGGVLVGEIPPFRFWVYSGWYVDDAGTEQPILPAGTVIGGSAAIEGYEAYAAIQDPTAGFQALPIFPKSWVDNDPPVRWIMSQSAPLVVPYRPNASFRATVL